MAGSADALVCSLCGSDLSDEGPILRCASGHAFDVAKQGYVNMLVGSPNRHRGDTASMVAARARLLERGHYDWIADAVVSLVRDVSEPCDSSLLVDVGAGTGWLLSRLLTEGLGGRGIALDLSKFAARRSARAHPSIRSIVFDAWEGLPVRSDSAAWLLNFFAPRNPQEFARILESGGYALIITPREDHLAELRATLPLMAIEADKTGRLLDVMKGSFSLVREVRMNHPVTLSRADVCDLVRMGPSAHHVDEDELATIMVGPEAEVEVTMAVVLRVFVNDS